MNESIGQVTVNSFPIPNYASSSNNVSNESCPVEPVGISELNATINALTLAIALVGNILLMAAFLRMKEPVMLLIANMAASDILTAIFLIPRLLTFQITHSFSWQIQGLTGTVLCKMCNFLTDISMSVSTQSLVLIAVERFFAVFYPLKIRRITANTRRSLVALTWVVSAAIHSPYIYLFELVEDKQQNIISCQISKDSPAVRRYAVFLFTVVLLIPLAVIPVLYSLIFFKLRIDKMSAHRSTKGVRRSRQRFANLLKLALATVLAVYICLTGHTVFLLLQLFVPNSLPPCNHVFMIVCYAFHLLASCYCIVNPVICFFTLRNFRGQLQQICKLKHRGAFNIHLQSISKRCRASTGNSNVGIELLNATPKFSSCSHSTLTEQKP
ncbi:prokineticin receptor 2-like [Montipora foliosa]|uniref:prokineticin receptor 2-like n=1 Tax=Montipora foliosa TaxID=591990 RepID=UPI0035F1B1CB